jgi:hypothetical protein
MSLKSSRIVLPIVGGQQAATAAGLPGTATASISVSQATQATGYGDRVGFTATVEPGDAAMTPAALPDFVDEALPAGEVQGFAGLGTPSGAVQFEDNGKPLGAPVPLHDGQAGYAVADLLPGPHAITAVYLGGGPFDGGASGSVAHDVSISFATVRAIVVTDSSDPAATNGLDDLLTTASGAPDRHVRDTMLNAFQRQAGAQSGLALTAQQAGLLIALAEALK